MILKQSEFEEEAIFRASQMAIVSDCVNTNAKSIENLWFSFFYDYCKTDAVVIL